MAALSLRLPDELESRLDAEARLAGMARSDVVREAIEQYLARRERERVLAGFADELRTIYGDPDLRADVSAVMEAALVTDNEALDVAEGRSAAKAGGGRGGGGRSRQRESRK